LDNAHTSRTKLSCLNSDHRFEVDGALGATKFVKTNKHAGYWSAERLEHLYDGISLHGSPGIAVGKNIQVQTILNSIAFDNPGLPSPLIPTKQYDSILKGLPNEDILQGTNQTWTWLAQTKPIATYDTIVEPFGVAVSEFKETTTITSGPRLK
jgi:hypothetical protein